MDAAAKSPLWRNQSCFLLKFRVREKVALHSSPTATDSAFLISAFPVHSTSFPPVLFQP